MPSLERLEMQYLMLICVVLYIHVGVCNKTKVFYFAYGSNLLAARMHINIPTAELYSTAVLQVRFFRHSCMEDQIQVMFL